MSAKYLQHLFAACDQNRARDGTRCEQFKETLEGKERPLEKKKEKKKKKKGRWFCPILDVSKECRTRFV